MRKLGVAAAVALVAVVAIALVASRYRGDGVTPSSAAVPTPTRTPTPKPGTVPTPTPAPPPPAIPAGAAGLSVYSSQCIGPTPTSVRILLMWSPSRSGIQYLDLTTLNNGYAPGTFVGVGPFAPDTWAFMWDGILQGTTHFLRVNTYTTAGWLPSETIAFYTPVCDAAAAEPAPRADMIGLRDRIGAAIGGSGINTAVAITDLQTGETIDVGGYDNRLPGCTINLFALMRVVEDLQFGRYPEPQPGDLISRTIYASNPVTSRDLVKGWLGGGDVRAGMNKVNDWMHALGMGATLMDHPPAYPEESMNGGIDNRITARDVNRGLRALWDGRVLTPQWRDYLLAKMQGVKPGLNYLIPAGVGYGGRASHKNGFLYSEGWADNDIGIVWFQRGGQRYGYAISFYTQAVPTKYADIGLGQRISSLAWQWFVGRYGYP